METPARKRYLVVCRVGEQSLHREWIGDPATRSYDVWLDAWSDAARVRWQGEPGTVSFGPDTTKWLRMAQLLAERPGGLDYEAYWFPDDDLSIDAAGVERLFTIFGALGCPLAQPALTPSSFTSHYLVVQNTAFAVRFTNFVEVMAPLFTTAGLRTCRSTFGLSVSGWGLDHAWAALLAKTERLAIIDATPVIHTRPMGKGGWYDSLPETPMQEKIRISRQFGVKVVFPWRYLGGLSLRTGPDGQPVYLPLGPRFLAHLVRGAPEPFRRTRRYWKVQYRSFLRGLFHRGPRGARTRASAA